MMTYATLYVSKFFKNFKIQEKIIIFYFSIFLRKTGLNEFIININSKIFIVCLQIFNMVLTKFVKKNITLQFNPFAPEVIYWLYTKTLRELDKFSFLSSSFHNSVFFYCFWDTLQFTLKINKINERSHVLIQCFPGFKIKMKFFI